MRIGISHRRHCRTIAVFIVILITGMFFYTLKRLEPAFYTQLSVYANSVVTEKVNKAVYEAFDGYEEFSCISETADGKVCSMSADTAAINRMKSEAVVNVREELKNMTEGYVKIPLMSISGFPILNGMGIRIPVRITPSSMVESEYDESFISTGINQTRHKFDMIIRVQVLYSGFLLHKKDTIVTQVPLINSVINGDVPQYYGNLAGTDASLN